MTLQEAPSDQAVNGHAAPTSWDALASLVWADADGRATDAELEAIRARPARTQTVMLDLMDDVEASLAAARRIRGPLRRQIQADLRADLANLKDAYVRLTGAEPVLLPPPEQPSARREKQGGAAGSHAEKSAAAIPAEPIALQLSWEAPRVVAWAAGARGEPEPLEGVLERLVAAGVMEEYWVPHTAVALPGGMSAEAVSADVSDVLGWLVGFTGTPATQPAPQDRSSLTQPATLNGAPLNGAAGLLDDSDDDLDSFNLNGTANGALDDIGGNTGDDAVDGNTGSSEPRLLGSSALWLRAAAGAALGMVAQGRTVPLLRRNRRRRHKSQPDTAEFRVEWRPAPIDAHLLKVLVDTLPGSVSATTNNAVTGGAKPKKSKQRKPFKLRPDEPQAVVESVLRGVTDALMCDVASRLNWPEVPPNPRTLVELGETFLANLDGTQFMGASGKGAELVRRLETWAKPVSVPLRHPLVVTLDEPDDVGAWHLAVLAHSQDGGLEPVEVAMVSASSSHRGEAKSQLARLERLLPALMRPGGRRRGEVVLTAPEAWELMSETGPALRCAGFDVRVPRLQRSKPPPALRLTANAEGETKLGINQLTAVTWTAMFGDVELTAEQLRELSAQARPLVRSKGRWTAIDHADLAEAQLALAERSGQSQLTGAQMLRQALGLEGTTLEGGVSIAGSGWAADLLAAAGDVGAETETQPEGFVGELRTYQAEALAWLGFLDDAGLGGCLALDMGLGKTPIMLAQARVGIDGPPTLVIAPPAVVGNWAAEAARFTPDVEVVVHHGQSRADESSLLKLAVRADVVLTTYGTAVRDIDALTKVNWGRVVLDEAQIIKNHNSATAKTLRELNARTRVALTGTPIENGLSDLWSIMDFCNPGLVGERAPFVAQLSKPNDAAGAADEALRKLNGVLMFRRTKAEPLIAAELPSRIDEVDHCEMSPEQIGLYGAVLDELVAQTAQSEQNQNKPKGAVLAAITALKQICNHPLNYQPENPNQEMDDRSGKLERLNELLEVVFAAGERVLIFTHFATWAERLAKYLSQRYEMQIDSYHGELGRKARDQIVDRFQTGTGAGALVLSLKAGGTGLNLTAANHVVLYDRWWNPATEDQARDRAWRIGQTKTVVCHRLVCSGTVDERVEEVVAGKRMVADMVLPKSSSLDDLSADQLRAALGIDDSVLVSASSNGVGSGGAATVSQVAA